MKCKCGNKITGYDKYLLGNFTEICVECADEKVRKRIEDTFPKLKPISRKKGKKELRRERIKDERGIL